MTQQLVAVTFNDEDPIVVAGVPHPGGPTELIDFTATAEAAFKLRDIRNPHAKDQDDYESFTVSFKRHVSAERDYEEEDEKEEKPKPRRRRSPAKKS